MNAKTMTPGVGQDAQIPATLLLVALRFGQQSLFVPQREIGSLESGLDLRREGAVPPTVGMIELANQVWPVYCLSDEGWLLSTEIPASRRVCLLLDVGEYQLALVCDRVEALATPSRLYPLPACMAQSDALIEALVVQDEHTVDCLTTTARLAAFCLRQLSQEQEAGHG